MEDQDGLNNSAPDAFVTDKKSNAGALFRNHGADSARDLEWTELLKGEVYEIVFHESPVCAGDGGTDANSTCKKFIDMLNKMASETVHESDFGFRGQIDGAATSISLRCTWI